jgi:hypothetical protein
VDIIMNDEKENVYFNLTKIKAKSKPKSKVEQEMDDIRKKLRESKRKSKALRRMEEAAGIDLEARRRESDKKAAQMGLSNTGIHRPYMTIQTDIEVKDKVLEAGPLEILFSGNATAKVMDFLITAQDWDYSETDIANASGIALRTFQRELSKLLEYNLIRQTRTVGNAKMYQLNKPYKTALVMEKLAFALAEEEIQKQVSTLKVKEESDKILA